ncbi:MAG TPA: hypothetical protein GXZ32_02490 [Clostridiales bacterium]|nr:hypothetical protein [Clostridiales bacterium]
MNLIQLFRIVYTFVFTYILLLVSLFILAIFIIILLAAFVIQCKNSPKRLRLEHTFGIDGDLNEVFDKTVAILDSWGMCILDRNRQQGYIKAVKRYPFNLFNWEMALRFVRENGGYTPHTRVVLSVIPKGCFTFLDRVIINNSTKRLSSYYGISN